MAALAGACIGFLRRNFHPARVFMGDAGSMTIGFILASVAVLGVLKTAAAVAVGFPLVVLFVPLLDTSFVIARRLKYGQAPVAGRLRPPAPPLRAHRLGPAPGRAAPVRLVHVARGLRARDPLRALPRPRRRALRSRRALLAALGVLALGFTVYVVYVLEILKQRHLHLVGLARRSEVPGETPLVVARRERRERVAAGR